VFQLKNNFIVKDTCEAAYSCKIMKLPNKVIATASGKAFGQPAVTVGLYLISPLTVSPRKKAQVTVFNVRK